MTTLSPSKKIIGTHSGTFQADEALGVWLLRQLPLYYKAKVIRSRDLKILEPLDILLDVGGIYDHSKLRYDHHQRGYNEYFYKEDESITKLSASGLIYRHYGKEVIKVLYPNLNQIDWVYEKLYKNFMEAIDAVDTGVEMATQCLYQDRTTLSTRVSRLNPRWNEESNLEKVTERFEAASALCGAEFSNALEYLVNCQLPARDLVLKALENRCNVHTSNEIIRFESGGLPWKEHLYELEKLLQLATLVKFVLYTDSEGMWRVQAVTVEHTKFENRVSLPKEWRGLRDLDLQNISGIAGATFVHSSGFIGGNSSYDGALQMAILALEKYRNELKD